MSKIVIGHLYRDELNLYGDNGNVEVLVSRCLKRNIDVSVVDIGLGSVPSYKGFSDVNILFMGGGPDSSQKLIYDDFLSEKRSYISDLAASEKVGIFVCGSYQLMGNYYKSFDGSVLEGLGLFNIYTENFGSSKPRCIGNVRALLNPQISQDPVFKNVSFLGNEIVGFENHGGRTFLDEEVTPFAHVTYGSGNNSEDGTEGVHQKNFFGTYFHGPVLAKNPHLTDYLIAKALNVQELLRLDDGLSIASFSASKKLR